MRSVPDQATLERLRAEVGRRLPEFLADLESIVNIESGSYTKAGVDAVATWMAARLAALGASVERHPHETLGDTIVATFEGPADGRTAILIGHTDTVFDEGYLARRPFEIAGDTILGPGVSDMKSGLLTGIYALEALRVMAGAAMTGFGWDGWCSWSTLTRRSARPPAARSSRSWHAAPMRPSSWRRPGPTAMSSPPARA